MEKKKIINTHIHTFNQDTIPQNFVPGFTIDMLANKTFFESVKWFLHHLNPFSDNDILDRFNLWADTIANKTQKEIFLDVRKHYPEGVYIFVVPPTWDSLVNRLRSRGQDDESTINKRLRNAREELEHLYEYEYVVVNENFDEALRDLELIILAEHRRLKRLSKSEIDRLKTLQEEGKRERNFC